MAAVLALLQPQLGVQNHIYIYLHAGQCVSTAAAKWAEITQSIKAITVEAAQLVSDLSILLLTVCQPSSETHCRLARS